MSKKINGNPGPVEQPIVQDISPLRGIVTTRRWECATDAIATTRAALMANLGWTVKLTLGAKSFVEATTSGDGSTDVPIGQATDSWELVMEETQKEFYEADIPIVNNLSRAHLELLKKYITGESPYAAFTPAGSSAIDAEYLWLMHLSGFKSVEIFQPVFRINRTVDRAYNTKWEYQNVGRLHTTARVKSESFAPADFLVSLDQITSHYGPAPIRSAQTPQGLSLYLSYAWKKYGPTVTLAGYDKKTIQQQYKFGLWEQSVHGGAPL